MLLSEQITKFIYKRSQELGFQDVGISKVRKLEEEESRLSNWLKSKSNGEMDYMANHFDMRLDPKLILNDAKSIISFSYNYFTSIEQKDKEAPKISKYAYGRDYHKVVKNKLKILLRDIREEFGEINGRFFTDSAPILEKSWANKSGLGWVGKHTNLISKSHGSFFFLAELILDVDLQYNETASKDYCGSCTRCIDACPTDAIADPYQVDGSKCISYLTIELKNEIPESFKGKMDNWMFGCDICQDVCPWNRFSEQHNESDFNPNQKMLDMTKKDWKNLENKTFEKLFKGTPVNRTKFEGLTRNIRFLIEE